MQTFFYVIISKTNSTIINHKKRGTSASSFAL